MLKSTWCLFNVTECILRQRNGSIETKLVSDLLWNYDPDTRPITDPSPPINVSIDLVVNVIIELVSMVCLFTFSDCNPIYTT